MEEMFSSFPQVSISVLQDIVHVVPYGGIVSGPATMAQTEALASEIRLRIRDRPICN